MTYTANNTIPGAWGLYIGSALIGEYKTRKGAMAAKRRNGGEGAIEFLPPIDMRAQGAAPWA